MSNFLHKSRDMYLLDQDNFKYFSGVFESINNLSLIKNYYDSDLFNIEEILSITEMMAFLEGKKLENNFKKYIIEVIKNFTPETPQYNGFPGNWEDFIFGPKSIHSDIGFFIAHLQRLTIEEITDAASHDRSFHANTTESIDARYSILSLNYDLVLEEMAAYIGKRFESETGIVFNKTSYNISWDEAHLMKLHGCVDSGIIVPPTWAKGTHPEIVPTWKNAYHVLKDTNHIRFIGYSLPSSDSYLKYLLKSSIDSSTHLKGIDVICLDNDGSVKERYDDFFKFNYYRFSNKSVNEYVEGLRNAVIPSHGYGRRKTYRMDKLESWYNTFMEQKL